jgi:uncharacterized membrane protein
MGVAVLRGVAVLIGVAGLRADQAPSAWSWPVADIRRAC